MKSFLFISVFTVFLIGSGHAQTLNIDFPFEDLNRNALLKLPAGFDGNSTYPLVLLLHPLGGNGQDMLNSSGLIAQANDPAHPFMILSPDAIVQDLFGASEWNEGINPFHTVNDMGYLNALLDSVIANYPVQTDRIYCAGFSDGGFMTNRLACEMADRIAAFASVGGTRASSIICNPGRAVPLFHIHGTADDVVGYFGDVLLGITFLANAYISVDELIEDWRVRNNCGDAPPAELLGSSTESYTYQSCDDGVELWLYKVNEGGHVWNFNSDFNTAEIIWEFFDDYVLSSGEELNAFQSKLKAYPNPTSGRLTLDGIPNGTGYFEVINLNGELVITGRIEQFPHTVSLSNVPGGLYLIRLVDSEGHISSFRIIKE